MLSLGLHLFIGSRTF